MFLSCVWLHLLLGDCFLFLSQLASAASVMLPDVKGEYFYVDGSLTKDNVQVDEGTKTKGTVTPNLTVTPTKFKRDAFSVVIQVLALSSLVGGQAGIVSRRTPCCVISASTPDLCC